MQGELDLRLNLIPINFDSQTFKGYQIPYIDREQLKELRRKYLESHVFRRQGDILQCVPLNNSAEALGEEKEFNLKDDFVLVERLVQNALIRFFQRKNMQFSRLFNPTTIILEKENLMQKVVEDEELAWLLPMYPEYEIESRLLVPHDKKATFGIQVNFSVRHLVEGTAKDLIDKKVDVLNRYVESSPDDLSDSMIDQKYKRNLTGKIIGIEGSKLKLSDYRDKDEIDANSCFLEPSLANFNHCLASLAPQDLEDVQQKRMAQIFVVTSAKNQYERLEKVKDWFVKSQPISCANGLSFIVDSDIYQPKSGKEVGEYRRLAKPVYVLRPGGSITQSGRVDSLIDKYGPFDTESFPKKRVRIAVVFPERFKGNVEVFIRQFKDGVPSRPSRDIPYLQGFIRKYHLTSCEFDLFPIDTRSEYSKGYKEASLKALGAHPGYDLAIIVTREDFHALYGEENPYFVAKSAFISQGVPVQAIEIETIQDERGRPWILNNLALASYAKLRGIPWVLSAPPGMAHELIFGIGSSRIQTERLGKSERFVGITTVFSGDGNYLLYNLTKEVRYEDYQEALLRSLKECMDEVKVRYGWQQRDKVRLIFHQSFKEFRNIEAQAVKEFVDSITSFDVEYAFIHISRSHPWKVFDKLSEGAFYWQNHKKLVKGECVPQRGFCIPLGPRAALLTVTGPSQLKTSLQGCPEPLLISVHKESTFFSQDYLIDQIFKLTFMSWRSFSPSTMPVTIDYSDMIARFMGQLRAIPNWNPDVLATKLRDSRWFL